MPSELFEKLAAGDTTAAKESLAKVLEALGLDGTAAANDNASGVEEGVSEEGLDALIKLLSELVTQNPELTKQLVQDSELMKQFAQSPSEVVNALL
ncbi:hypothetical protein POL68_35550 [Stigmatella sp. ncwal1]|uniref:Uncharacterized protein n=1 Tax=Stigmatella ashevillensis TaxID=2995309 RepID=A0ABT5DJJ6_9BACT|nr:hypothetical protein [Stigmatella ashevillena]MDC0713835.1 hypothetical protein [Stigmatella ashevillena]